MGFLISLLLVPTLISGQIDADSSFAKAKATIEGVKSRSSMEDAECHYQLTDHIATSVILRSYFKGENERKEIVRFKFSQIEAILTRPEQDRAKPKTQVDPLVYIVLKSEPEFLDLKKQKWVGYEGDDVFEGLYIACETHQQSDQIASELGDLAKAHGYSVPVLKGYLEYQSENSKKINAEWAKQEKAREGQAKKKMKPSTSQVRGWMKNLADCLEIYGNDIGKSGKYETRFSAISDEGFTLRRSYQSYSDSYSQVDSVTVPWHQIGSITYYRTPSSGDPFLRIYLKASVKRYRKGFMSNSEDEVQNVEIVSSIGRGVEDISNLIGAICIKRGLGVSVRDSRIKD